MNRCSAFFVPLVLALAPCPTAWADTVLVKAPRTCVVLAQKWAEAYAKEHPQADIDVSSGGPDAGVSALQNNKTDLALSTRKLKPSEGEAYRRMYGRRPREYRVAVDSLCIYVNADNPVTELDLGQVSKIFCGAIRNWKQVGGVDAPITVYGRERASGAYDFFKTSVLGDRDFASGTQPLPSGVAVLRAISKDKNGIAFAGAARSSGARALKIKKSADSPAVEGTEEHLLDGTYPLSRFLYVYLNPVLDRGAVAAFLDWIRSDAGQTVAGATGCHPLPPNWREKSYAGNVKTQ